MLQNLGVYDPGETFTNVRGRTIQGFGEDEMVRTERIDPNEFSALVGAQGDFTFVKNLNRAGLIIITLQQLSPDNVFLNSLLEGQTIFTVEIRTQHSFIELVRSTSVMVGIAPRKTFGKSATNREWQLVAGELIETNKAI